MNSWLHLTHEKSYSSRDSLILLANERKEKAYDYKTKQQENTLSMSNT